MVVLTKEALEAAAKAQYERFMEDVADLEPRWDDLPESHQVRMMDSLAFGLAAIK